MFERLSVSTFSFPGDMDNIASLVQRPVARNRQKIIWLWKSNRNPFDLMEEEEWKRYSDFENEFIEEAFQKGGEEVELNDYVINFKQNTQFKKDDEHKQRPIKREEIDLSQYVREERFCCPDRATRSFEAEWKLDNVLMQWQLKHFKKQFDFPAVAELAAQGIIEEGRLLNQNFDAQRMAEQLRNCGKSRAEICACAARLYTAESFLYKHLNACLRVQDTSKLDSLGPFRWLIFNHLCGSIDLRQLIVYRGMDLTNEMIDEYKDAIGSNIVWPAYTSTTKDRRVAETYGNTLFIITIRNICQPRGDISCISQYPDEQEVLLNPQYKFKVKKVERDPASGKYLVYIKSAFIS